MKSLIRAPRLLAYALLAVCLIPAAKVQGQTPQYPVLQSGYTQELFAAAPTTVSFGGVAFGPGGNVWVKLCDASVSLLEFDAGHTATLNGSTVHPQSVGSPFPTAFACGLTNHPDGHVYMNTPNGVMKIDASTGAALGTTGPVGNSYGITVDPQTNQIVYPGKGCSNGSSSCAIVSYDPASGTANTLATFSLPVPFEDVDGMTFDPTGNFMIIAGRTGVFPHDTPYLSLLSRSGALVQQLPANHFPDGMAFHENPFYMVANNNDGTITRYDFPQGDLKQAPAQSVIASGGFRGDLTGVGPDGCLYATQAQTRYANGTVTKDNSVIRVCSTEGGFVQAGKLVATSSATHFVPVTPCRIADTRNPNGAFGGPAIAGGASRDFAIPGSACNIPTSAAAYSMNVAVVPHQALGYITLWPAGQSQPLVATLNSLDGRVKSNAAIVPAGTNGAVSVFATDTTDVILDINGYFVAGSSPTALAFYPVTPCRVADTRNQASALGGPSLAAQSTRAFPILNSQCELPADAEAYSLNFAVVPKAHSLGYLTAWPTGLVQPLVASLNDLTGTIAANAAVVPAGANGAVSVFTTDATDLIIDTNGYFAPQGTGGLALYTMTPCRVLDTRLPAGSPPISTTLNVNVTASPCNVPPTARAFVFNATVIPLGSLGYITMWAEGQTQPLASTLNAIDGAITNNMAIVPTANGSISVFPSNPTHLVLDLFGYLAP